MELAILALQLYYTLQWGRGHVTAECELAILYYTGIRAGFNGAAVM